MGDQTLSVLNSISDEEWEKAIIEINAYASQKIKKYKLPDNFTSEDYFQEAVTRLFEEKRKWDSNEKPDIIIHLKSIVKSLTWADFKSKHNFEKSDVDENNEYTSKKENEKKWNNVEVDINYHQLYEEIQASIKDDYDLEILFMYLEENDSKTRSEIAHELDWTEEKLNNTIKKLRRKRDNVLKKFQ